MASEGVQEVAYESGASLYGFGMFQESLEFRPNLSLVGSYKCPIFSVLAPPMCHFAQAFGGRNTPTPTI